MSNGGSKLGQGIGRDAMSTSPLEFDPIIISLIRGETVLDLGCGFGHWGHLLMTHYRKDENLDWRPKVVGIDRHPGNVEFCRRYPLYEQVIEADVLEYLKDVPGESVDTVLFPELIEHLEHSEGEELLKQAERVAKKAVILTTPNFSCLRGVGDGITGQNRWEHHLSVWTTNDFLKNKFKVIGVGNKLRMARMRGIYRLIKMFPLISNFADAWAMYHPNTAMHLIAYKYL